MKKTSPTNLTQAQQIEHYRNQLKTVKINWIVTGFLFGAFCGWAGAWFTIVCISR